MQERLLRIGPVGTGVARFLLLWNLGWSEPQEKPATGFSDSMLHTYFIINSMIIILFQAEMGSHCPSVYLGDFGESVFSGTIGAWVSLYSAVWRDQAEMSLSLSTSCL